MMRLAFAAFGLGMMCGAVLAVAIGLAADRFFYRGRP